MILAEVGAGHKRMLASTSKAYTRCFTANSKSPGGSSVGRHIYGAEQRTARIGQTRPCYVRSWNKGALLRVYIYYQVPGTW